MRVLVAHVSYRQRGGEDAIVDTEVRLLREAGHDVSTLLVPSDRLSLLPKSRQLAIGAHLGDHSYGRRLVREAIARSRAEVVHFHNLYPLLGSGAMREAAALGCAAVQTFHNYRLSCIAGTHFRAGAICEQCSPSHHMNGVVRGCYRESRLQSLAMAGGVSRHWDVLCSAEIPDVGICLTEFMRDRLINLGAPPEALVVKSNSVEASCRTAPWVERDGAVFVGRLSPEKGIAELVAAWPGDAPALTVVGTGPLLSRVRREAGPNVNIIGEAPIGQVRSLLSAARVCVIPSVCFEGLPTVVLEAFAEGTPAVGFALGALTAVLAEQGTCATAERGDFQALCEFAVASAVQNAGEWNTVSSRARSAYAEHYSDASNAAALESVYALACHRAHARRG